MRYIVCIQDPVVFVPVHEPCSAVASVSKSQLSTHRYVAWCIIFWGGDFVLFSFALIFFSFDFLLLWFSLYRLDHEAKVSQENRSRAIGIYFLRYQTPSDLTDLDLPEVCSYDGRQTYLKYVFGVLYSRTRLSHMVSVRLASPFSFWQRWAIELALSLCIHYCLLLAGSKRFEKQAEVEKLVQSQHDLSTQVSISRYLSDLDTLLTPQRSKALFMSRSKDQGKDQRQYSWVGLNTYMF